MVDDEKGKKRIFLGSITFAVVLQTIIHAFITQPLQFLQVLWERTLLVGDFLFVNKWSYGYRMLMRPWHCRFTREQFLTKEKTVILKRPKILCRCR